MVVDDDPARVLHRLRDANRGGDVHLIGGPRRIETYRALGALDEFRLLVLPMLAGDGRRVTPDVDCELVYAAQSGAANPRNLARGLRLGRLELAALEEEQRRRDRGEPQR